MSYCDWQCRGIQTRGFYHIFTLSRDGLILANTTLRHFLTNFRNLKLYEFPIRFGFGVGERLILTGVRKGRVRGPKINLNKRF